MAGVVTTYPFQGTEVFVRIPWYRGSTVEGFYLLAVIVLSVYLVARPEPVANIRLLKSPIKRPGLRVNARRSTQVYFTGNITLFALLVLGGRKAAATGMLYGVPIWFDVAGILAFALALLWLPMAVAIAREVRDGRITIIGSTTLAGGVVLQAGFLAYLYVWNLVGIHH